jgi:hypothetical protein
MKAWGGPRRLVLPFAVLAACSSVRTAHATVCMPSPSGLVSQAPDSAVPRLRIAVVTGPIHLDGVMHEAQWSEADSIANLIETEPTEGGVPSGRTVVRVLTTGDAIIIGVRADDPQPAGIVSYARQRDASLDNEDYIKIVLDTYRNGRSGYVFAVNPNGARYDALVSNGGEGESANWDAVWEAATARTPSGWAAEIRIPLKSLLFRPGLSAWGFNVQRHVQRLLETDRWASARRDYKVTLTSQAGLLTDLPRFDLGVGFSVRPSVTLGGAHDSAGAPLRNQSHGSLDVTQRLGDNTLASLTVNTDFAETEVDTRQVNLTRFPLFFPEKRTFFLEGSDIFDFGLGAHEDVVPFFSRRIGLVEDSLGDNQQVPLDVGVKVNGRLGNTNVGALAVRTGDIPGLPTAANMAVVRVKQNVLRESSVGFIATAGDPVGRPGSWLVGPDLTYQTSHFRGDKNLRLGVWGLAVGRQDLVGERTAVGAALDYPNDLWDISASYKRIGDAFDPSLGFVPRPGVRMANLGYVWQPRPTHPIGPLHIRQCFWENELSFVAGLTGGWQSYRYFMAPINCRLESGDRFEFNIVPTGERITDVFELPDSVMVPPGAYHFFRFRLEAGLATKRRFNAQATWWFGGFYDGRLDQFEITGAWKPSSLVIVEFSGEHDVGRMPEGNFTTDLAATRVRLNVSPDLQLSTYLQYDSEAAAFGTNTRLRWTFGPPGDLFVVYNHNLRTRDPVSLKRQFAFVSNQLLVKLQYVFRY